MQSAANFSPHTSRERKCPAGNRRQHTSPRDRDLRSSRPPLLPRPGWQILLEETVAQRVQVERVGTLHAMAAVRVFHEMKLLVERDQPIEQPLGSLEMDAVVARAVDDQQLALQPLGE